MSNAGDYRPQRQSRLAGGLKSLSCYIGLVLTTRLILFVALAGCAAAQNVVHDRKIDPGALPSGTRIELKTGGFLGDSFRFGKTGETWAIESIRVWAIPTAGGQCPRAAGDRIEKIVLLGGMDNPPQPGQFVCRCHALLPIATAPLIPGADATSNPDVRLTVGATHWEIEFDRLGWSIPGGADALFAVRAVNRSSSSCDAAGSWTLATAPADKGYRLQKFDKDAIPDGLADATAEPVWINVEVRARRLPR